MRNIKKFLVTLILPVLGASLMLGASNVFAEGAKHHKLVIQVSTDDARTQNIALNNAVNIQKLYGMDNVDIEIVAYGPGLGMLTPKNKEAPRVKSLAMQNITFSACGNTMAKIEKKTGKKVALTEGVKVVPGGVARITELQEDGYAYIRP
jgi:uncharacterized protein